MIEYLDPALQSDPQLIQQHKQHFTKADTDKSGCITWNEAMDWKTQEENGKTGQTETPQGSGLELEVELET